MSAEPTSTPVAPGEHAHDVSPAHPSGRRGHGLLGLPVLLSLALLHGLPWWLIVGAPRWPTPVTLAGSLVLLALGVGFPIAMWQGHGHHHRDRLAVLGDTWLGVIWMFFTWSIVGAVVDLAGSVAGWPQPGRPRVIALVVLGWVAALAAWGSFQARRVPRVVRVPVVLDRLGPGLHGLRVVLITDTHFGPINRARWSARVAARVADLSPDVLVHAGDLADGSVAQRQGQVAPLHALTATDARVYITGNHEYFSGAAEWMSHMEGAGWIALHNRHVIVGRGEDRLAVAGIDDLTAAGSGVPGHGADLDRALAGVDPAVPVLLLAHQPKQVRSAVAAGVDLQLSGHTHGGQIWPFHLIVRAEQGALHGLTRHGTRTQLYTSRGTGFWGPPFRVFAPSEITLLELRSPGRR